MIVNGLPSTAIVLPSASPPPRRFCTIASFTRTTCALLAFSPSVKLRPGLISPPSTSVHAGVYASSPADASSEGRHRGNDRREPDSQPDPRRRADQAQRRRLDEELRQDVAPTRTERHS